MAILPLPQFEADMKAIEADRKAYDAMRPPRTIVVRYGVMKLIGEFPYRGDAKPGCGSKIVVQTHRGTEIGEMLTSTCPNSGCTKSVSREQMLRYIENSGGRDYPFSTNGRAIRVATHEDMTRQAEIEGKSLEMVMDARRRAGERGITAKIVQAEPILGGERITFYYASEERIDMNALADELASTHGTKVDMRQVGARDEARLVADYEKCGQYCCCKNFLKVLKPVSMRSAKTQKATLDPLKISGRCGRLMCCLRYEDETYESLKKRLPHRKTRVGTPHGDGTVMDSQILTQLVLVRLDSDGKDVAVPVEELTDAVSAQAPPPGEAPPMGRDRGRVRPPPARREPEPLPEPPAEPVASGPEAEAPPQPYTPSRKRIRKRRRGAGAKPPSESPRDGAPATPTTGEPRDNPASPATPPTEASDRPPPREPQRDGPGRKRKRRRRRRGPGDGPPTPEQPQ